MARRELKTKITASDEASAKILKIRGNLKNLGDTAGTVGGKMVKMGAAMTAAITGPAIYAFQKISNLGSDLVESVNVVGLAFGAQGQRLLDFTKNAENMGVSTAKANQELSIMALLMKDTGLEADELVDRAITLGNIAADLASAYNVGIDDALNALRSGLSGETEALKKLAIDLNEAKLQQIAFTKGITDEVRALDMAEKKLAIYEAIVDGAAKVKGDFANTSEQVANATRIATAEFQNEAAMLGLKLLPIKLELIKMLREAVKWFSELSPKTQKFILIAIGLAAALGPVILGMGAVILGIKGIAAAALFLLANPALAGILLILTGIAMLGYLVITNWTKVKYFLLETVLTISYGFLKAWDFIGNVFATLVNFVIDGMNAMLKAYNKTIGKITGNKIDMVGKMEVDWGGEHRDAEFKHQLGQLRKDRDAELAQQAAEKRAAEAEASADIPFDPPEFERATPFKSDKDKKKGKGSGSKSTPGLSLVQAILYQQNAILERMANDIAMLAKRAGHNRSNLAGQEFRQNTLNPG